MDSVKEHLTKDNCRHVMRAFTLGHGLLQAALESTDYLLCTQVPEIICEKRDLVVDSDRKLERIIWQIDDVSIWKPTVREEDGTTRLLLPMEARIRKLTYACTVNISYTYTELKRATIEDEYRPVRKVRHYNKPFCKFPVMVRSYYCNLVDLPEHDKECPLDEGGYYIISGTEKAVIMQEKARTNYPSVRALPDQNRFSYVCEIRSLPETKLRSTSTLYIYITRSRGGSSPSIYVMVPFITMHIPLCAMFRLLGVESKTDMMQAIIGDPSLHSDSLVHLVSCILDDDTMGTTSMSMDELIQFIGKKGTTQLLSEQRVRTIKHMVANEFLPHMGLVSTPDVLQRKTSYFGYCIWKLVRVYTKMSPVDDRDDYRNKRIETPGMLLALLFRQHYRNYIKMLQMILHKALEAGKRVNPATLLNPKKISANLQYPLATGNWGVKKGGSPHTGVAQVLTRTTYTGTISHLRRVNKPLSKKGKMAKPRMLNGTHSFILCPAETPEGESCGLMQNLAYLAHVRVGCRSDTIQDLVLCEETTRELLQCPTADLYRDCRIFINGILIGTTTTPDILIARLRKRRQTGDIPIDTSLTFITDIGEIHISTDSGNPSRPVFVLENISRIGVIINNYRSFPNGLWNGLLEEGVIQYMDKEEEDMYTIAPSIYHMLTYKDHYTHMEIHPSMMLGICANLIPFPEHNQAPRNMYEAAMQKQRMSISMFNFLDRVDSYLMTLDYGQKPLVQTFPDLMMHGHEFNSGCNLIVAVQTYTGGNCEDATIMNKASIERGLFSAEIYRTYRDEQPNNADIDGQHFRRVDPKDGNIIGIRDGNYSTLEEDGLPAPRTIIQNNDAVIGKVVQTPHGLRDLTTFAKSSEQSQVTKVLQTIGRDDRRAVIVQTRARRVPEVGDKFSSHHGQKGVIGMILPEVDMPFTISSRTGGSIIPDLIVNPHGFPSRMTLGQQLEMILGKAVCIGDGDIADGTAFQNDMQVETDGEPECRKELIYKYLHERGFQPHGNERMINGMTGEMIEASIFVCPVQYQRLRHMVKDKMHPRSTGPCSLLTRQPTEGRSKEGGLRFGEMERDNIISHGASAVLKDRLFEQSDLFPVPVCEKCGYIAESKKCRGNEMESFYCRNCDSTETVVQTYMPYAFKLLLQEIYALHIGPKLEFAT